MAWMRLGAQIKTAKKKQNKGRKKSIIYVKGSVSNSVQLVFYVSSSRRKLRNDRRECLSFRQGLREEPRKDDGATKRRRNARFCKVKREIRPQVTPVGDWRRLRNARWRSGRRGGELQTTTATMTATKVVVAGRESQLFRTIPSTGLTITLVTDALRL